MACGFCGLSSVLRNQSQPFLILADLLTKFAKVFSLSAGLLGRDALCLGVSPIVLGILAPIFRRLAGLLGLLALILR